MIGMNKKYYLFESRGGKTIYTQDNRAGANNGGRNKKNLIMNLGNGTDNETDDAASCTTHQTEMPVRKTSHILMNMTHLRPMGRMSPPSLKH